MADTITTLGAINLLTDAYPNIEITPGTMRTYRDMLSDLSPELLRAAVIDCVARHKWLPTIAEIRETAHRLSRTDETVPTAAEAWVEISGRMGNAHVEPEWSHPLVKEALRRTGGWRALNLMPIEELKFERVRFEKIYEPMRAAALEEATRPAQVGQLTGTMRAQLPRPTE